MDANPRPRADQHNRLLRSLSDSDFALLQPHLEAIPLELRRRLEVANRPVRDAYFIDGGLGSVVAVTARGRQQAEVAVIGREGMAGLPIVLGVNRSPCDVFMQIDGHGQRISADALRSCIDQSVSLLRSLLSFAHVFALQSAYTALANARGTIEERLARWLLMAHDRIDGDDLALTHEFLSLMLGNRRSGVTVALGHLQGNGMIEMARGALTILDRKGLEQAANGLYGVPEAEFERVLGN